MRVLVAGSAKATLAIAAALERRLGDRIDGGAVVVRRVEDDRELARIEVLAAGGRPGAGLVHRGNVNDLFVVAVGDR